MLTKEQNRIRKAIILNELCRQYDAATEIAIHLLHDDEVGVLITWLDKMRYKLDLRQQMECDLPRGLYRPRRGDHAIARDNEPPEDTRHVG